MKEDEEAVQFAEWIAENHYRLINVDFIDGYKYCFWGNEDIPSITTERLFTEFQIQS